MKRLLVVAALFLVAAVAGAATNDQLLTSDGTLYALQVWRADEHPEIVTPASSYFVLTSRRGTEIATEVVPSSMSGGWHRDPALAFEPESGRLFVFWIHHVSLMSNELLFASRDASGTWSEPASFGSWWNYRENLQIAVTGRALDEATGALVPGISVHATWWEFDSYTGNESAKYAMFAIEKGEVAAITPLELDQFRTPAQTATDGATPATVDPALLKQPLLFPTRSEVQLTFGSLESHRLDRVTIRPTIPVAEGRIRIPVGRTGGPVGAPPLTVAANSSVKGIAEGDGMALYTREGNSLRFVILRDGAWSETKEIALDEQISADTAVEALRRLVREH